MNIADAKPNSNLTLDEVTVQEKGDVREFDRQNGSRGRVCNCKISDATGEMQLTLWDGQVDDIEAGQKYKITDGWVKEFQGNLQISTGKSGKIEKL